jgi:hypothetical protein
MGHALHATPFLPFAAAAVLTGLVCRQQTAPAPPQRFDAPRATGPRPLPGRAARAHPPPDPSAPAPPPQTLLVWPGAWPALLPLRPAAAAAPGCIRCRRAPLLPRPAPPGARAWGPPRSGVLAGTTPRPTCDAPPPNPPNPPSRALVRREPPFPHWTAVFPVRAPLSPGAARAARGAHGAPGAAGAGAPRAAPSRASPRRPSLIAAGP